MTLTHLARGITAPGDELPVPSDPYIPDWPGVELIVLLIIP
jgi:hypothetical protein